VQIKGGKSFFSEVSDEEVIFPGERRHLEYWLGHSLPVMLALHDPSTRTVSVWSKSPRRVGVNCARATSSAASG
jgi:hypothetical protein